MAQNKLKIKYVRSAIGRSRRQKQTVQGLGFSKLNQVREIPDVPALRAMVHKISHLVKIVGEQES